MESKSNCLKALGVLRELYETMEHPTIETLLEEVIVQYLRELKKYKL